MTYVETEEEKQKPRYVLTGDIKGALTDYYDAVHTLCEAQQNFAKSTQVLEKNIEDKSIFLDIIKQVQLPSVKVEIRTVEEMERMEGKTYRELTLMCHLPNFKRINPNAKEQTRTMAVYIYCVLYEQITGIRASQTGCATDFRCPMTPFKRLITGKRQPGRPGRSSEARGGSSRSELQESSVYLLYTGGYTPSLVENLMSRGRRNKFWIISSRLRPYSDFPKHSRKSHTVQCEPNPGRSPHTHGS